MAMAIKARRIGDAHGITLNESLVDVLGAEAIAMLGGLAELRDRGLLESAVNHPRSP